MLAGSSTFSSVDCIPGFALVTSARRPVRRPDMITWFPLLCRASARLRPIPEVPPVMNTVFPLSFIISPFVPDDYCSPGRERAYFTRILMDEPSRVKDAAKFSGYYGCASANLEVGLSLAITGNAQ